MRLEFIQQPRFNGKDNLETIHRSPQRRSKPDVYRLDNCGLVYALDTYRSSLLQDLADSYFSSPSSSDYPTSYNVKAEPVQDMSSSHIFSYPSIGYLSSGSKACTATLISPVQFL